MSESCRKLIQPCAPRRLRLIMRTPFIIGVLVLLLNVHGNSASAELTRSGRELTEYRPHVLESSESDGLGLLVVTLLDGRMVAVRQDSGEVLWTYDTGSPLVTFQQGQAMPPGPRIIPGVDGGLYVYGTALAAPGSGGGGAAKLERLRTSLPELVDSSPSLTHDGSVILGKRLTRAYLLDRHTGVLLQGIREGEPGGGGGGGSGVGYGAQDEMEDLSVDPALGLDLERVVVVGWEHYVVRSVQMETGAELWNATYSRCMFVRPAGQTSRLAGGGSLPGGGFSAASSSVLQFTLKADHTLQAHDPTSRIRRWAISFATPPVALFAGPYGDVNFLDPTVVGPPAASVPSPGPTAPGAGGGPALLPGPGGPASAPSVTTASSGGSGGGGGGGGGKLALLGRLPTGGMYVMPAGHLLLDPQMEPISPGVPAITAGPGDTALAGDNTCGGTGGGFLATAPICRSSTPSTPSDLLPLPAAPSAAPSTAPGSCSSSPDNAVRTDLLSLPAAPSSAPSATSSPSSPRGPGGAGGPTVSSPWVPATGGAGAVGGASRVSEDRALALIGTGQELVLPMSDDVDLLTEGEAGAVSGLSCHPGLQLLLNVDEPGAANPPLPWLPHAAQTAAAAVATGGSVNGEAAGWLLQWDGAQGAGGVVSLALLAAGAGAATAFVVLLYVRGGSGGAAAVAAGGSSGNKPAARLAAAAESGCSQVVAASRLGAAGVEVEVDAVAVGSGSGHAVSSSSGVGGSSGQEGGGKAGARTPTLAGSAGAAGGRRRKSGRTVGTAAADEVLAAPPSRPPALPLDAVPLPRIGEEEQLESAEETSATLGAAAAPFAAAPSLPSAETRVRVQADGSLAIGRLVVGPGILGYGSGGTIVYDGVLDGRPVAVKRLLRQFAALARKEIQVLILSDEHPNVVRCFAMEEDREFVYLALERCRSTLSDYLDSPAGREAFLDPDSKQPTARCFSAMLDVCRGLAALHARGIVHRDLKPHNVLLTEGSLRAKLSDMGLSKTLVPEQSSFESHHGPGGSSGWQAPEQLIARDGGAARQTRSMDVFSLGCILYYCMTGPCGLCGSRHRL